jgi:hypothetical protein
MPSWVEGRLASRGARDKHIEELLLRLDEVLDALSGQFDHVLALVWLTGSRWIASKQTHAWVEATACAAGWFPIRSFMPLIRILVCSCARSKIINEVGYPPDANTYCNMCIRSLCNAT